MPDMPYTIYATLVGVIFFTIQFLFNDNIQRFLPRIIFMFEFHTFAVPRSMFVQRTLKSVFLHSVKPNLFAVATNVQ